MSTEIVFNQRDDVSTIVRGLGPTSAIVWAEAVKQLVPEMGDAQVISMGLVRAIKMANVNMSDKSIATAEQSLLAAGLFESLNEDRESYSIPKSVAFATYGRSEHALDSQREYFFGFEFFSAL